MRAILADVLIVLGLLIVTVGVYGVIRLPDAFTQSHAASKAGYVGVVLLLGAAAVVGGGEVSARAFLVAVLLTLTTPVSAHIVVQSAMRRGEFGPNQHDSPADTVSDQAPFFPGER